MATKKITDFAVATEILTDDVLLKSNADGTVYQKITPEALFNYLGLGVVGKLTGSSALSSSEIDFKSEPIRTYTMSGDTTFTFINPIINKSITLILQGNFAPSFTGGIVVGGSYDGTVVNYVQLLCISNTEILISYNKSI
jgi:hypothetical protein